MCGVRGGGGGGRGAGHQSIDARRRPTCQSSPEINTLGPSRLVFKALALSSRMRRFSSSSSSSFSLVSKAKFQSKLELDGWRRRCGIHGLYKFNRGLATIARLVHLIQATYEDGYDREGGGEGCCLQLRIILSD